VGKIPGKKGGPINPRIKEKKFKEVNNLGYYQGLITKPSLKRKKGIIKFPPIMKKGSKITVV